MHLVNIYLESGLSKSIIRLFRFELVYSCGRGIKMALFGSWKTLAFLQRKHEMLPSREVLRPHGRVPQHASRIERIERVSYPER